MAWPEAYLKGSRESLQAYSRALLKDFSDLYQTGTATPLLSYCKRKYEKLEYAIEQVSAESLPPFTDLKTSMFIKKSHEKALFGAPQRKLESGLEAFKSSLVAALSEGSPGLRQDLASGKCDSADKEDQHYAELASAVRGVALVFEKVQAEAKKVPELYSAAANAHLERGFEALLRGALGAECEAELNQRLQMIRRDPHGRFTVNFKKVTEFLMVANQINLTPKLIFSVNLLLKENSQRIIRI